MNRRLLIVFVLLIAAGAYIHLMKARPVLLNQPLDSFPMAVGEWTTIRKDTFSQAILDILRPTDYLSRDYVDAEGHVVTLYIGYHGGRKGDGGIHSPRNCLPGAGWFQNSMTLVPVDVPEGKSFDVVNTVMSKGSTVVDFYYWFQVRGRVITNEYSLKLAEIWNSMSARRKDAAFIRLSMAIPEPKGGKHPVLDKFVNDFYPLIYDYLPQ